MSIDNFNHNGKPQAQRSASVHSANGAAKKPRATSAAGRLVQIGLKHELFHTPDGDEYASFEVNGHAESHLIRSKQYKAHIVAQYFRETRRVPGTQAVQDAVGILNAEARENGPEHKVYTRIFATSDRICIDLCNPDYQVIEVTPAGYSVTTKSDVKWRRPRGARALPLPQGGGSLADLKQFLNYDSQDDFVLLVAWLLGTLAPDSPYPPLILGGEHGSTKSTITRVLRSVIDANEAAVRTVPRDERDGMIGANNCHVVAYDNISTLQQWLSDMLCRLSTGSGFATRQLTTDSDEIIFNGRRPIILNGIGDFAESSDLIDRAILISLPVIPSGKRIRERVFWQEFEAAHPRILGALLEAAATGLRNLKTIETDDLPRMADFAAWVMACAPALEWDSQEFLRAYTDNRGTANTVAMESSAIARHIPTIVERAGGCWMGTTTELLSELEHLSTEAERVRRGWPSSASILGTQIKRLAPNLRAIGFEYELSRSKTCRRITLRRFDMVSTTPQLTLTGAGPVTAVTAVTAGDSKEKNAVTLQNPHNQASNEPISGTGDSGDSDSLLLILKKEEKEGKTPLERLGKVLSPAVTLSPSERRAVV